MQNEPTPSELMHAIVDLHGAMLTGFTRTEHRFESIDKRFEAIDRRFEEFEMRMIRRFDSVDLRFDVLERRIGSLDAPPG